MNHPFDRLAKGLATGQSRRSALRKMGGGTMSGLLLVFGFGRGRAWADVFADDEIPYKSQWKKGSAICLNYCSGLRFEPSTDDFNECMQVCTHTLSKSISRKPRPQRAARRKAAAGCAQSKGASHRNVQTIVSASAEEDGVWTSKMTMPTARSNHTVGVVNDKLYVIGGWRGWSGIYGTVEEHSPPPPARYPF